jgi:hypothetical protein
MSNPFDRGAAPAQPSSTPTQQAAPTNGVTGGVASTSSDDPYSAAAPVGLSGLKMKDPAIIDQLLLVEPVEYSQNVKTDYGITDVWRVNIIPLSGPLTGQIQRSVTVWQEALKRELSECDAGPSKWLLAYHHLGTAKGGQSAPHLFTPANEEQKAVFEQWRASQRTAAAQQS